MTRSIQRKRKSETGRAALSIPSIAIGFILGLLYSWSTSTLLSGGGGGKQTVSTGFSAESKLDFDCSCDSQEISNSQESRGDSNDDVTNDKKNDDGWHSIEVFYGNTSKYELVDNQFVETPKPRWTSQIQQDQIVTQLLKEVRGGFFLDLASNEAWRLSNTFALETYYNWTGLCVEPNPMFWYELSHYRTCQLVAALIGHTPMEQMEFTFAGDGGLGGIVSSDFDNRGRSKDTQLRFTVPLENLLKRYNAPNVIDYMSLDVEGAEFFIMSAFPYDQYTIRVLTVERPKPRLKELLVSKGYIFLRPIANWGEELWVHHSFLLSMDYEGAASWTQANVTAALSAVPQL